MKKFLVTALILLIAVPVFARGRAPLTNTYAVWNDVTTGTTVTLPYNSRDVWIHNGSAVDICVSLRGDAIPSTCVAGTTDSVFQLDGTASYYAQDFVTNSITFRSITGLSASPVSVIITY